MRSRHVLLAVLVVLLSGCAYLVRSSVSSSGAQGNAGSRTAVLSADGRFTAFVSFASNLVSGDTNGASDIFVRDNRDQTTERVSIADNEAEANGFSGSPAISGNGRFVAFSSTATDLVAGDSTSFDDIFVRDRQAGTTRRVSVATGGAQANMASDDPAISDDGNLVVFRSAATNLVPNDTNAKQDIFVRNLAGGTTTRVSLPKGGSGESNGDSFDPAIDPSGGWVAFASTASDLVAGDANGRTDVFLTALGRTDTVFRLGGSDDDSLRPALSQPQGGFHIPLVAFQSDATDVVPADTDLVTDVFVSTVGGATERVSVTDGGAQPNGASFVPSISGDGLRIAFESQATNLVSNDTNARFDVFVRDRAAFAPAGETTTLASETEDVNGPKNIANEDSMNPTLSRDGRYVAFESEATNLVSNDTNNALDVFTRFAVPPTVGGISPEFAARGTTLTVTVLGRHFLFGPDPTVSFGSGITVNTLSNESPSSVDVNITISNSAATGARPVFLLDAGTGPGATAVGGGGCASCFTVT